MAIPLRYKPICLSMLQWAFYDEDTQLYFLMYFCTALFVVEVSVVSVAFRCVATPRVVLLTFRILQIRFLKGVQYVRPCGCTVFVELQNEKSGETTVYSQCSCSRTPQPCLLSFF